ncbi:YeiH family protein [Poseidonocella sedimentorum]|uniref:Conserved hypothetical integral membrane protein n=1 Tax=Poseidonocella sedimentorum TaxID=871652 RepID=A0A1I6D320_9RHOB|nr:putative sulfate exporter family transporter [Poseidonocella sedimentorum]SFQ99717.1 conserved hypothetical integral membrane protein [Poseidonocella sedimentorum]
MTDDLAGRAARLFPGLALAAMVAMSAQFLSEHYGAPVMLMAILLGMPLQFLSEEARTAPGIAFASRSVLRIGVALLGLRVSAGMLAEIGPAHVALVLGGVAATVLASLALVPLVGRDRLFAFLTGGAVAICGASAAMAISSILPRRQDGERDLAFTVISVTLLSTLAMILYPILARTLGLDPQQTGIFLGGTIHDVAQVVGAGYSVSDETGDISTLVKLFRVTLLAPVVFLGALVLRGAGGEGGERPPLLPGFVAAFLLLAAINTAGFVPDMLRAPADAISRALLVTAVAAVGMRTSIAELRRVGGSAFGILAAQTVFIAAVILIGLAVI